MVFIDTIASCAYLLVGMTRLQGAKEDELKYGGFFIIILALSLFTLLARRHPVPSSISSSLFLFFQIILICKSFDAKKDKPKYLNKNAYVIFITIVSLLLYMVVQKLGEAHGKKLSEFLFTAQVADDINTELDEDLDEDLDEA